MNKKHMLLKLMLLTAGVVQTCFANSKRFTKRGRTPVSRLADLTETDPTNPVARVLDFGPIESPATPRTPRSRTASITAALEETPLIIRSGLTTQGRRQLPVANHPRSASLGRPNNPRAGIRRRHDPEHSPLPESLLGQHVVSRDNSPARPTQAAFLDTSEDDS